MGPPHPHWASLGVEEQRAADASRQNEGNLQAKKAGTMLLDTSVIDERPRASRGGLDGRSRKASSALPGGRLGVGGQPVLTA